MLYVLCFIFGVHLNQTGFLCKLPQKHDFVILFSLHQTWTQSSAPPVLSASKVSFRRVSHGSSAVRVLNTLNWRCILNS